MDLEKMTSYKEADPETDVIPTTGIHKFSPDGTYWRIVHLTCPHCEGPVLITLEYSPNHSLLKAAIEAE